MKKIYAILMFTFFSNLMFQGHSQCYKPDTPTTDDVKPLTIDWVWENRIKNEAINFKNLIFDQIFDNGGYLNYIVRWESTETVTATKRDEIEVMLRRQINNWFDIWLTDYDCWPFDYIDVNVVAWAVSDRSVLLWDDNDWDGTVYVGYSEGGAPHGPPACNRFHHQDGNYPNCNVEHFDMALWCTEGFIGGAGGDWGQRVSSTYILENTNEDNVHILLHEMGHGCNLPDFYDANQFPPETTGGLPQTIMRAGNSTYITPWDGWMLRRVYSELKNQTDRGWEFDNTLLANQKNIETYQIYPIPVTQQLHINSGHMDKITLTIFDMYGKLVYQDIFSDQTIINKSEIGQTGIYIAKISSTSGNSFKKIIVK